MTTKEQINQQLNHLSQEQLNQVSDFITFLKFREKLINPNFNTEKLANLYQESLLRHDFFFLKQT